MELIEETIGMSRLEEMENALTALIDLVDVEELIPNPYLSPEEIETVLKVIDRAATALYGEEDSDEQN